MYDILLALICLVVGGVIGFLINQHRKRKELGGSLIVSEQDGIYLEVSDDRFIKDKTCHFILLKIVRTR